MKKYLRAVAFALALPIAVSLPAVSFAEESVDLSSSAGVSVEPPALVEAEAPPCPEPGQLWTPGHWAWDAFGGRYYWVPGAWVEAPYVGALWTPGYWAWRPRGYFWYEGYWGPHVGYYGGINYGYGYYGVGFVGGAWRGRAFAYNTAVVRVDRSRVTNVYENRTVVNRATIVNNHVSYNGGAAGVTHAPTPAERAAEGDRHSAATAAQRQRDASAYASHHAAAAPTAGGAPARTPALAAHGPAANAPHAPAPGVAHSPAPGVAHSPAPGVAYAPAPGVAHAPAPGVTHAPAGPTRQARPAPAAHMHYGQAGRGWSHGAHHGRR